MTKSNSSDMAIQQRSPYLNRRKFFKVMGAGLVVTFGITHAISRELIPENENQVAAWIHIGADSNVTIFTGKAEVGQNIRTSLSQIVAEELGVDMGQISMIMGDTDLTPYDRGTFGSRSIPYMGPQLRTAAASARDYLIEAASKQWNVSATTLHIADGKVIESGGRKINIGELTRGQQIVAPVRENVKTKSTAAWTIAGKPIRKVNGVSFLTGKHKYVSDMKLPGMLFGKVLRAPAYGATLSAVDTTAAKEVNGVVIVADGEFVAVAAPTLRAANEAIGKLKATWTFKPQPSREHIFAYLKDNLEGGQARDNESKGDAAAALQQSKVRSEQTFLVDYIAHVPLEPRAGLAEWKDGKVTVWTGTQRPFGVQEELQDVFKIAKEKIRVIMPDTGSGYGGKHTGEAGIEAARIARVAGKPVKVMWTREEEFMWAYFRPAGVIEVKAGCNKEGELTAWEFHNYNSGGSGISTPYDVAAKKIVYHPCHSPLRQGSYRGLAATANTFARECIMHDLADALKMDQLVFRLKNLTEERMKAVLQAAAQKFGWSQYDAKANHGIGIACGEEKAGFVATCAEVVIEPDSGRAKVVRATIAFECGAIINPHHLEAQIGGSLIQGLGGALFEWIDFREGKILNPSISMYRVPRFLDVPKIDIVTLDRKDIPSAGAGETPILAIAPAIRNAMAMANGIKLYTLPLQRGSEE